MVAASAPIHAILEFFSPLLCTVFFPSPSLLSYINIVKAMESSERGINPVSMAVINPWKEYWPSRGSNQQLPVLKSCMLPTELWGWARQVQIECIDSANDKLKLAQMLNFVPYKMKKKMVGKGEIAGYEHFLLSPQCFHKPYSSDSVVRG